MDYLNCRTEGDNNQDFIPQGDASLAGAVYGLYANADIIRSDGKSGDRTRLPTNIRMDYCPALPFRLFTLFTHREHPQPPYLCAFPACSHLGVILSPKRAPPVPTGVLYPEHGNNKAGNNK